MEILIFTEGTITKHKNIFGIRNYASYIPVGNAVEKIRRWKSNGAKISYLTSRKKGKEIQDVRGVLKKYGFPRGKLLYRKNDESYSDVAERIIPDILIEDNCKSIGGKKEMAITNVKPEIRKKIKSIVVKEFEGIDYLPDKLKT